MLRWAVIGTSFISDTVAAAIARSPGSELAIAVGRDRARLEAFGARHDVARATTSLDEALADPDVDAVYVGAPNHVHHEITIAAARAGKAVLSEKSLTVTMAQTDALLDAVVGRVFFVEGLMYLAHPVIARFVEVLRDGRLGRLRAIEATYAADIARFVNPAGAGAIYNLGCYPASLAQLVVDTMGGEGAFGEHRLRAVGNTGDGPHAGNVVDASAAVRFASGALATLHTAETYGTVVRFAVHGEHGTLAFATNPWMPEPGDNRFTWARFDGASESIVVDDPLDAFDHQVRMVERCVAEGRLEAERPSPRPADSRALMQFLTGWEYAVRSIASERH
jgi:predicted dehydrogenase